jgi:hypothetical protein
MQINISIVLALLDSHPASAIHSHMDTAHIPPPTGSICPPHKSQYIRNNIISNLLHMQASIQHADPRLYVIEVRKQ